MKNEMRHVLDRPIWESLAKLQSAFAVGSARALRYAPEIGPLAAAQDDSEESMSEMALMTSANESLVLLQAEPSPVPLSCVAERFDAAVQMIAPNLKSVTSTVHIEPLSGDDAAEMVALATLTQPGPFRMKTHELGVFSGIRHNGKLVAMAGERMKLDGYTEVSGVCTHPEFRGRGYGAALSHAVAARIRDRGETPFLHARAANTGAISLYESLGFTLRREMTVTVLRRSESANQTTGAKDNG